MTRPAAQQSRRNAAHTPSDTLPLPDQLRLIASGRWVAPYQTGRAQSDLEGDVLREAARRLEEYECALNREGYVIDK